MFSRALRTSRAAGLPKVKMARMAVASRAVTTDAASAHAEKEHVPEVRRINWDLGDDRVPRGLMMRLIADCGVGG